MKTLITFILLMTQIATAAEFKFNYKFEGTTLQYKTDAPNWETAFKRGAHFCYDFHKNKKPFNEERLLDLIDVCANPR